jgi:hypothetical protein
MQTTAEHISLVLVSLTAYIEAYISLCYTLAADGRPDATAWKDEADFADNVRLRFRANLQDMLIRATGGYVETTDIKDRPTLLICTGDDSALVIDLAMMRKVQMKTGMPFHRIIGVTRDSFDAYLRRERTLGRRVRYLHLSVHASTNGVQFADGEVNGDWLSERLLGVEILLLAGCEGDTVGDWLGVVPYVVTLSEKITHEDAAALTQHFWTGIGNGLDSTRALAGALKLCPPVVGEFVTRHW